MTQLPPGWAPALLGEVAATSLGKMLDSKRNTGANPVPYLRNINVRWGAFDLRDLLTMDIRPDELDRVLARRGDVIACEGGEPGRAAVWPHDEPIAIQKALHLIRPKAGIDPRFLALLLRYQASSGQLDRLFTGTTIKHLPQEKLRLVEVPIPPTCEQERIVVAIEEAFSLLDAGETALHNTRTRLKRMRDSVLTAAVTGQLVPQDPTDTPATSRLVAIGCECPEQAPKALPRGWAVACLSALLAETIGGVWGSDPGTDEVDVRVIRVTEMRPDGSLDPTTAAKRSIKRSQLKSRELRIGDLLLEKSGGGPTRPVGRVGMVRGLESTAVCANFMQLLRADERLMTPAYLEVLLRAFHVAGGTAALQTATTNIRNLKMKDYFAQIHAVPPLEEQVRIVAEVERQFSFIETAERAVDSTLGRSAGLRRSVLKAAFEGRLVPQDPADEPASVLLERIAAERRAAAPSKRAPRGARGKVVAS
ncbi:MAG: restriction endonuclease subunit S [Propionicimonas sp.]